MCIRDRTKILKESFLYQDPLSPDQAALKSNSDEVSLESLKNGLDKALTNHVDREELLVIESVGGVNVPLNSKGETLLDMFDDVRPIVFVVARGNLGTINHTTLTVQSLWRQGFEVGGVIFSGDLNPDNFLSCLLYTSPSPRDATLSRMPSSA